MPPTLNRLRLTKLVAEPWFIDAAHRLKDPDGVVAYTITAVSEAWLERMTDDNPETWEEVGGVSFSSLDVYRSGTTVGGILDADVDADPPAGTLYRLKVAVTITATAGYGGESTSLVLEADVEIPPSARLSA